MIPLGSRPQDMTLTARAAKMIAALFIVGPYNRCAFSSQLCRLAITFSLLALPFAGTKGGDTPILSPLAVEVVSLGTTLQQPPTSPFSLPPFALSAKPIVGRLSSPAFTRPAEPDARYQPYKVFRVPDSLGVDVPNGRSPPTE